jgi:SAM-dependent methyltransferase
MFENLDKNHQNLFKLAEQFCDSHKYPKVDLGGGYLPTPEYVVTDIFLPEGVEGIESDLTQPWPFIDSSVGMFRAGDIVEHLPDKNFTMEEAYRCLVPGGFLFIRVPSTDGRGAWSEPHHVSYWNSYCFSYYDKQWREATKADYLENDIKCDFEILDIYDWNSDPHIVHTDVFLRKRI